MDTTLLNKQFSAAVRVIQSLPSDGSFKPSHELMLKFYAFYKQATIGPCKLAKPGFWDVVAKAKWGAWSGLGEMASEEAMEGYISELVKIIEKMPRTDEVANMTEVLDEFEKLINMSAPADSTEHASHCKDGRVSDEKLTLASTASTISLRTTSRTSSETDSEDYLESSDTFAVSEQHIKTDETETTTNSPEQTPDCDLVDQTSRVSHQHNKRESEHIAEPADHNVPESLRLALRNMQEELQRVDGRLQLLEQKIGEERKRDTPTSLKLMKFIPLKELTTPTILFNIIWPLLVCWLVNRKLTSDRRT